MGKGSPSFQPTGSNPKERPFEPVEGEPRSAITRPGRPMPEPDRPAVVRLSNRVSIPNFERERLGLFRPFPSTQLEGVSVLEWGVVQVSSARARGGWGVEGTEKGGVKGNVHRTDTDDGMDHALKVVGGCTWPGDVRPICMAHQSRKQEVLVGDATGNVQRIRWQWEGDGELHVHRREENKNVGGKKIQHILVLDGARAVAVMSNGEVNIYDEDMLESYALQGVRNAASMNATEMGRNSTRLAVVCKKTLLVFQVKRDREFKLEYSSELLENVESVACIQDAVFVATKQNYLLCQIREKVCKELMALPSGKVGKAMLHANKTLERAVLVSESVGILTDKEGLPIGSTLPFPVNPIAMADSSIFLCAADEAGVRVYDCINSRLAQNIELPMGKSVLMATDRNSGMVTLCNHERVVFLAPLALEDQVCDLIARQEFESALSIAKVMDDRALCSSSCWLADVQAEIGLSKLVELEFEQAMELFKESTTFRPSSLFPLFPEYTDSWKSSVERMAYLGLHSPVCALEDLLTEALYSSAAPSIIQKMIQNKYASMVDIQVELFDLGPEVVKQSYAVHSKQAIAKYLEHVRTSINLEHNESECVHTLLAYLYLDTGDVAGLEHLFTAENTCSEILSTRLAEERRFHALALLLRSKGKHSDAAELWVKLADGKLEEAIADNGAFAETGTSGFRTIAAEFVAGYLAESGSKETVRSLLPWVLDADWESGMKLLLEDLSIESFSREEIMTLLECRNEKLVCQYMCHLVEVENVDDPALHTKLALMLAKLSQEPTTRDEHIGSPDKDSESRWAKAKLSTLLEKSTCYDVKQVLEVIQAMQLKQIEVILLKKLKKHSKALRIIALELLDCSAAEKYCREHGGRNLLLELFHLYLHPGDQRHPMYEAAAGLLEQSELQFDPKELLAAFPRCFPVQQAAHILHRILHSQIFSYHQEQIAFNLAKAEHLRSSSEKFQEVSQSISVTTSSSCSFCCSRIDTSIFALLPGNKVVCYRCYSSFMANSDSK